MPQPKKRHSRSRQGTRRATWKLKLPTISTCPACGAPTLPHHACPSCGQYKGRQVLTLKEKKEKAKE